MYRADCQLIAINRLGYVEVLARIFYSSEAKILNLLSASGALDTASLMQSLNKTLEVGRYCWIAEFASVTASGLMPASGSDVLSV